VSLAALAARLGLGSRKLALRRRLVAAVDDGDLRRLTRLVDRERAAFAAERFGCRFTSHLRWRRPPEIVGVEEVASPSGLGAKCAVVAFERGAVSYRLMLPGWHRPAVRAQNIGRLVTRIAHVHPLFEAFAAAAPATSGRLLLNVDDVTEGKDKVVGFSGRAASCFLVPDQIFVATEGYAGLRRAYAERWVPFEAREDRVFWRGRPTGRLGRGGDWRTLPRAGFVAAVRRLEREMPEVAFDVGLVKPEEKGGDVPWDEVERAGLSAPFVPIETFVRQRVHVDIDGNSNSWPGLFSKLLLGGTIVKIGSPFAQWYYDRLDGAVAWAAGDFSDLAEVIARVRAPDEGARLAAAAKELGASLDYAGEIERALPTIAAAIAHWTARL
jgi:hypothetical protein